MVKVLVDTYNDTTDMKTERTRRKVSDDKHKTRNPRGYSYLLLEKTQTSFQDVYDYLISTL